ncbi:transcriptional regulator opi1 [Cytospora paraplurivora]|uniref:Transcriptional regulator opi1 n=1 Tax=Cytospora paraplurivora TaxID=2898453 RepID=A0AAN9U729_9PEZI
MDVEGMSHGLRGPLSPDPLGGRASSVSLDDPDVRMAAEALGDLKAVMTSGSLLAKPIEGTVSAYNTTKNFSPGFIKTPVDYIEGVVGSGLQMSGIEGGVRWFFRGKGRHHLSSDLESGEKSNKRRRVDNRGGSSSYRREPFSNAALTNSIHPDSQGQTDPYGFTDKDHRRLSMSTIDTLPAYDDARSPAYTENLAISGQNDRMDQVTPTGSRPSSATPTAWQSRLIMSTSGLSIAMSEESLRSLKYCLSWLRWANEHIGRVISALKEALDKYGKYSDQEDQAMSGMRNTPGSQEDEQARHALGARVDALRTDVLKTLQGVIETVSKYAGGALPDNARALVRRHLTSLPQRFRLATQETDNASASQSRSPSSGENKEKDVRDGAQRVLVLAKEGLDMMAQVSGVLDGTIVSAEEWCERLGRKKREDGQHQQEVQGQGELRQQQQQQQQVQTVPFAGVGVDGDVKMG